MRTCICLLAWDGSSTDTSYLCQLMLVGLGIFTQVDCSGLFRKHCCIPSFEGPSAAQPSQQRSRASTAAVGAGAAAAQQVCQEFRHGEQETMAAVRTVFHLADQA